MNAAEVAEQVLKDARGQDAIKHNRYNLSIPVAEYLELLVGYGCKLVEADVDRDCCDACNGQLTIFWNNCNALSRPERIYVQARIRETCDKLPGGPWEEYM